AVWEAPGTAGKSDAGGGGGSGGGTGAKMGVARRGGHREVPPPSGLSSGCAGIRAENIAEVVEAEGGLPVGRRVGQREQRAEFSSGASAEAVCRPWDERATELPEAVPAHGGG